MRQSRRDLIEERNALRMLVSDQAKTASYLLDRIVDLGRQLDRAQQANAGALHEHHFPIMRNAVDGQYEPGDCTCGVTYVEHDAGMGERIADALEAAAAERPTTTASPELPHDGYAAAVAEALDAAGLKVGHWTETPDGVELIAVFQFQSKDIDPEEWPDGVYLAWSQKTGWSLITEGNNRNIYDLDIGWHDSPSAVATRAVSRLEGLPDEPVRGMWDGAEALLADIERWEADGV